MDNDLMAELEGMMNQMKFREVIEKITELEEEERDEELTLMLAHCYSQCGEYRNALKALHSIENEVAEDDLAYHLELAGANFGLHKYQTAVKQAEFCLEIDGDCVEAWLLLCLIYQENGDDENFDRASDKARELDELAWQEIFGDKSVEMAVYDEEEAEIVKRFIKDRIGQGSDNKIICNNFSGDQNAASIEEWIVMPDKSCPYWRVITVGLGAYRGLENRGEPDEKVHRSEMVAYIPEYLGDEKVEVIIEWLTTIMNQFGEMIESEASWIGVGHTISYGSPLDESVEYDGVIFAPVFDNDPENECILPCDERVNFLQLIPLYEEEMLFKIENGYGALFERLENVLGDAMFQIVPERKNVCLELKKKNWGMYRSSMEDLLDWDGPDGCYATDRITVDNQKVGIMYRVAPEDRRDSGWRFLAGDEDQAYMDNIDNMDIFRLNTICNYDPDIIDYLESPIGSTFYRDEKGNFRIIN